MKFKISKKIVSLFLAVMMVVTSVPSLAMTAFAGTDNCKYLFAYFTGNTKYGQNVRFALSEDGYTFTALNNNEPVCTQTQSTTSSTSAGYARDPYITRDPKGNGYYMVATDMDASGMHSSWSGDSCVYVWHSNNLVDWTQISNFDFRTFSGFENTIRAWAPQIIWDSTSNRWMMYLSITVEPNWNVMYYTYTTDFKTFTAPQKFEFSNGVYTGRIDADIVEHNGKYYMYYKDETAAAVMLATADSLTGTYTPVKTVSTDLSKKAVEGNAMYQLGNSGTWVMMLDEYSNGTFAYGTTTDFVNFTKYTGSTSANSALTARHGSVMQITTEEYNRLKTATFNSASEPTGDGVDLTKNLVGQYLTTSDVTADASGKGHNLTSTGTVSWNSTGYSTDLGAASFTNGNYLHTADLKSIIGDNATGFTASFLGYVDSSCDDKGRFVEFSNYAPKSYKWVGGTTDNVLLSYEGKTGECEYMKDTDNWNVDRFRIYPAAQTTNSWHQYTVTYDSTTKNLRIFIDGKNAASATSDKLDSSFISALTYLNIGVSCYSDDASLTGKLRDLRVYNRAITDDEASRLPKQYQLDSISSKMDYANSVLNANTANNTSAESFNGDAYYTGNNNTYTAPESSRQNILYGSKTTNFGEEIDSDYVAKKAILPNSTVLVYDGVNTPAYPIYLQARPMGNDNIILTGATYSGSAPFKFNSNWSGYHAGAETTNIFEITTNKELQNSNDNQGSKGNVASTEFDFGTGKGFPTSNGIRYYWTNTLYYTGSGNTDSYYEKHSNNVSITVSHRNKVAWVWNDRDKAISVNNDVYILNYKPIYDILSNSTSNMVSETGKSYTFRDVYNEVYKNKWMYTEKSLASYLYAVAKLTQLNLNDSFKNASDNEISSKVSTAASQIKDYSVAYNAAVSNLKLKTFKIKFVKADGTEVDKTVTAGKSLSGLIPDVTAIKNNKNGTHDVYSWPSDCTNTYMPKEDVTFHEESVVRDCTYNVKEENGVITKVCSKCGYTFTLDVNAYNAAVAEAQAAIENTAKFTETSRNALQSVLNNNKLENAKSQPELNAMTKAIIEATNALKLNTYTVKFYKVINNGDPELVNEYSGEYGKDVTLESGLDDSYAITKWTKTVGEADEKVGSSNTTLLTRYYANVNYYVYASKAESKGDNSAIVALTDRTGRVVDNMYVDLVDGKATVTVKADVANKTVTVNGRTTLKAVDLTFYTIAGFKIGDTVLQDGLETQVDITKDLTISTVYDNSKSFNITSSDGSCTPSVSTAYWDQKVTVTADNTTANTKWLVNGVPVAYGTQYVFRATKDADIKCVTDSSSAAKATATVESLSYNSPTAKTITVVGSFNVPKNCTVVEKGVLMKTSSVNNPDAVRNIENYTGEKANARKFVATNYVKDTNQYAINIYSSKAYTSLCVGAVAYVTYEDANGDVNTKYSDLVTIDYNA